MAFSLWTCACDQLQPTTGHRLTLKKHGRSMSCILEPAIQSFDIGQRIPFLTGSIDHSMYVHKDDNYQVKHRLYKPWTASQ